MKSKSKTPAIGRGHELTELRRRARSWGKTRKAVRSKNRSRAIRESRES